MASSSSFFQEVPRTQVSEYVDRLQRLEQQWFQAERAVAAAASNVTSSVETRQLKLDAEQLVEDLQAALDNRRTQAELDRSATVLHDNSAEKYKMLFVRNVALGVSLVAAVLLFRRTFAAAATSA